MAQAPEDFAARMQPLVEDGFAYWKENCSAEQTAAGEARMAAMKSDPNAAANHQAKVENWFKTADVNNDDVLDEAEFKVFLASMIEAAKADGNFADDRPENMAKAFALFNTYNSEKDGVSLADWRACMGMWMGKFLELKTAAAQ